MKYCFYVTTNKVNGKKYLGIHGSEDFEKDNYVGSGTLLREAIRKYGKESFVREDIRYFDKLGDARKYEEKAITPEILKNSNYYNIATGGGGGCKGALHYYEGSKNYMVHPDAVPKFLEKHPKAVKGIPEQMAETRRKAMIGRITINNGKDHRLVPKESLNYFLNHGWVLGTTEESNIKNSRSKIGIRIMHKGSIVRHVRLEDIEGFKKDGYVFGPTKELNKKQGLGHRGLIKIYKDLEVKFVQRGELPGYLGKGFQRGTPLEKTKERSEERVGRKTIHLGTKEKNVYPEEISKYLEEGWILGRSSCATTTLGIKNRKNSDRRAIRSREEASTRKLIYTKSERYATWWNSHSSQYLKIHYGVNHFLQEIGKTKLEFLQDMKNRGEI